MPVTRQTVLRRVAEGQDPAVIGRAAHVIQDWVELAGRTWCLTPRRYWHRATGRELRLLGRWR